MSISRPTKLVLSLLALLAFSFIYIPLIVILINSFSTNRSLTWPPSGFTSEWWGRAVDSEGVRDALTLHFDIGVDAPLHRRGQRWSHPLWRNGCQLVGSLLLLRLLNWIRFNNWIQVTIQVPCGVAR